MELAHPNHATSIWTCPLCEQALVLDSLEKSWSCANKHNFDCAKEGYVNLLPSNKKHSTQPGDSAQMIAARRRIHTCEIYQPLADAVLEQISTLKPQAKILDIGCGEGYYSGVLRRGLPDVEICGVDISKAAIRLAAKNYPNNQFSVASSFALPVPTATQDVVVRIFAPSDDSEVIRVLKAEGCYLEVTPAPSHLWSLREALYDTPREHAPSREQLPGLEAIASTTVAYDVDMHRSLLRDLVAMTPFAHRGHREKREQLLARENMKVNMAFTLRLFGKAR